MADHAAPNSGTGRAAGLRNEIVRAGVHYECPPKNVGFARIQGGHGIGDVDVRDAIGVGRDVAQVSHMPHGARRAAMVCAEWVEVTAGIGAGAAAAITLGMNMESVFARSEATDGAGYVQMLLFLF